MGTMELSTYVSDGLTAGAIQKALSKVKQLHTLAEGRLEIITEDRYNDVFDIVANHFLPDEPSTKPFGVVWNSDFKSLTLSKLNKGLSVMALSDETNEVMGILVIDVLRRTDTDNTILIQNEPLRALLEFLGHKDKEIDLFNRFNVQEIMYDFILGVHRKYRRRGLGKMLTGVFVTFANELGFKALRVEATSNISQKIFELQEFDCVHVLPYDQYEYKGKVISGATGEHTCTKVFAKLL